MRRILAVSLVLLFGAGCLSSDSSTSTTEAPKGMSAPVVEPEWAVRSIFAGADPDATARLPDHDHSNRTLHEGLSTPNWQVLGHDGLVSNYFGAPSGTTYCGDVTAPGQSRQLAVVHSFTSDVALVVVDVTNRTAPKELGELVLPYVFTYDVAIFADGRYAVIAGNPDLKNDKPPAGAIGIPGQPGATLPFAPMWRDCNGNTHHMQSSVDQVPYGYAAILVDLADPENPTVADFYEYPAGRNVHSISTATVDGVRWVATSGLEALPCTVPNISGNPITNPVPCQPTPRYGNLLSHFDFLTVQETAVGARLVLDSVFAPIMDTQVDPALLSLANGHTDATIEKHPVTGQVLAYLADWDGGFRVVELKDHQPQELAVWGAEPTGDPGQMRGNIHSAWPVPGLRDGRHYVLVGQEVVGRPSGRSSGQVDLVDVTDPAKVEAKFRWTLPVNVTWPAAWGEAYSTHYPILVNDTLYVSLYHAGVWAADASPANWPDLPSIGVFMPDAEPAGKPASHASAPEVLEILDLGDGNILVFDGNTGAYVVRFLGPSPDVVPAAPWPQDWIGP